MIGGSRTRPTSTALPTPSTMPTAAPSNTAGRNGKPSFWLRKPTMIADSPMIAPTDRSMPRPIITKDSPSARKVMTTESAKMKARLPDDQKYGCVAVLTATTTTMAAVTRTSRRRSAMAHRGGMDSSRQADDATRTFRAVVITHLPRAARGPRR